MVCYAEIIRFSFICLRMTNVNVIFSENWNSLSSFQQDNRLHALKKRMWRRFTNFNTRLHTQMILCTRMNTQTIRVRRGS